MPRKGDLFRVYKDRDIAGTAVPYLSGAEQQMPAIARAPLGRSDSLLLDELSKGLATDILDDPRAKEAYISG